MSWIAEYDTQGREFPTCVHVTRTTGTMTHGATYVPIEDGKAVRAENERLQDENERLRSCLSDSAENERIIDHEFRELQAENVKLRRLVRDYDKVLDAAVDVWGIMADALGYGRKYDALHDRMRELGIEVDE